MFDKRIGFSVSKPIKNSSLAGEVYTDTIVAYDTRQTYGKVDISCTGTFIANELANTITLEITNYYPDKVLMDNKNFYPCEILLGYADEPNIMGIIKGEVLNVYTKYTGVDSKTIIQINNGIRRYAYASNVDIDCKKGTLVSVPLKILADAIGMTYRLPVNKAFVLKSDFVYQGNAMDGINKLKRALSIHNINMNVFNNTIQLYEGNNITASSVKRIKNVISPIRVNDGGISVSIPFDPSINVGDVISVDTKYFVNQQGIFVTNLSEQYYVYQIDFGFSTIGNMNYMEIRGASRL